MASGADANLRDNGSSTKQDVSRLVAVPNVSLGPKQSPANLIGLASPTAILQASSTNQDRANEGAESDLADVKWEYDVHATSFVPLSLCMINTKEARVIITKPKHCIDFELYAHTFVGTSFIHTRSLNTINKQFEEATPAAFPLSQHSYLGYFSALMDV
jgi:putative helicase MOV10L1/helicase MOV-10